MFLPKAGRAKLRDSVKPKAGPWSKGTHLAESPATVTYWVPGSGASKTGLPDGATHPGETAMPKGFRDPLEASVTYWEARLGRGWMKAAGREGICDVRRERVQQTEKDQGVLLAERKFAQSL